MVIQVREAPPVQMTPAAPITVLPGVGPKLAERLRRLGVHTMEDLLLHLPLRYQDRSRRLPIDQLQPGQEALIEAHILSSEVVAHRRRFLLCHLADGTGVLTLRFFHFSPAQQQLLGQPGLRLRCFGEVRQGYNGVLEMIHPECRRIEADTPIEARLTPFYPATAGLQQFTLRHLAEQALAHRETLLPEWLPATLLARLRLPRIAEAVRLLHQPPAETSLAELESGRHPARQRLAFEELLAHQLSLRQLRQQARRHAAPPLAGSSLSQRFCAQLPFTLTGAQQRVLAEISADLAQPRPMLRLLQGDVGSGKTVVAAAAALRAVEAEAQAALMAPTELLAEQHYHNFCNWLEPLGIQVAWLTGRLTGKARRALLERLAVGEVQVAVGTHALFQEAVSFAELALVIVDEQHRFGVHQRLALREKGRGGGRCPHQLIMTATPIPRTLAMSAYADLDASIIDELPPGREPIETQRFVGSQREEAYALVREQVRAGRQVFVICPLVEASEAIEAKAAVEEAERLQRDVFPDLRIATLHGRMSGRAKEAVMTAFRDREHDILVSTSVIEVGVDVPNATVMLIEGADRFGLAQLHQFRGRVGRGGGKSWCLLLADETTPDADARLEMMAQTNDGFLLAEKDLELRGPGDFLGTRQSGLPELTWIDGGFDPRLLDRARRVAEALLDADPDLEQPEHQRLRDRVEAFWAKASPDLPIVG